MTQLRSSPSDAAYRAYGGVIRGTLVKADDAPKMQTVDIRLMHDEMLTAVERFQPYGHSSVPLPPDQSGKKAAEVLAVFAHGNRSHPIIIAVDDRRYRPKNWQPGDAGLYHYQGATAKLHADGFTYDSGSKKKPHTTIVGNASVIVADGKITAKVNTTAVVIKDGTVYLGGDPDQGGTFDFVVTVSGPSSNVKAKL